MSFLQFFQEFVTNKHWVHLDIAGVMMNKDEVPYLSKGMSGKNSVCVCCLVSLRLCCSVVFIRNDHIAEISRKKLNHSFSNKTLMSIYLNFSDSLIPQWATVTHICYTLFTQFNRVLHLLTLNFIICLPACFLHSP